MMPSGAPRPCTKPGCGALVSKGSRCPAHPYELKRSKQARQGNKLYNTAHWRKRRKVFLNQNPLCVECARHQRTTPATVVDHITPHKGDHTLFYDESNWQAMCKRCHDRKTASKDGGFSR